MNARRVLTRVTNLFPAIGDAGQRQSFPLLPSFSLHLTLYRLILLVSGIGVRAIASIILVLESIVVRHSPGAERLYTEIAGSCIALVIKTI